MTQSSPYPKLLVPPKNTLIHLLPISFAIAPGPSIIIPFNSTTMLTVHHLQLGQSERIVWLCEELGIDYELKTYPRDPQTRMSPPELKSL